MSNPLVKRVGVLSAIACLASTTAWADCILLSPNLPPLASAGTSVAYQTADLADIHASYAAGLLLVADAVHSKFTDSFAPPPAFGSATHSFASTVQMRLSINGGATFLDLAAPANVSVKIESTDAQATPLWHFDTEMLELDISGGGLPPGVLIRESPTLASLGKTSIEGVSGGYKIDSFFDVFTELSIDGGKTWLPTESGPGRVALKCPDGGSTLALALIPVLGLLWSGRRIAVSQKP